jgi:cellulose synthase/poly-beta-1,6-N-acetylglucosamine synthase-like glycosyltransferase/tetratricopeptide (TPR) repeat protein
MHWLKTLLLLLSTLCSLTYLGFRAIYTLNAESVAAQCFSVIVLLAECHGVFLMLLYYWQIRDTTPAPLMPVLEGRTVDVFLPTYNEDVHLLRGSIQSYLAFDYPCKIYVLDDGNRPDVRVLCEEMGVHYIARKDNLHAKAGNINNALEKTDGEFVVIFDSDHVARPHFISRTIGYFADERVGWVQTPHAFYNLDSFSSLYRPEKNHYWEEGDLFYRCIQLGKSNANAVVFCGSAAIMRRKALEDVGLIATETITEDMHTGLRMHSRGWKSVFVHERLIAAQAASEVTAYQSQRLRWGEGNLSIIRHDNPLTMRGLTMDQRVHYMGSMLGWSSGIGKLALYLTPIIMLFTGISPVGMISETYFFLLLAHLVCSWVTLKATGMGSFMIIGNELAAMATFWVQNRAVYRAMTRTNSRFVVTKKRGRQTSSVLSHVVPQLTLIAMGAASIVWATGRLICGVDQNYLGLAIGTALIAIQSSLAWIVIKRALCGTDRRFSYRHQQGTIHAVITPDSTRNETSEVHGMCFDMNEIGVRVLCYEELTIDQLVRLDLHAQAKRVTSEARVIWQRPAASISAGRAGTAKAFYVGLKFHSPDPATVNALWELGVEHVVESNYKNLRFAGTRSHKHSSMHLPITLVSRNASGHEQLWYCAVTDFEKSKLLLTGNVPDAGEELLDFEVFTPLGKVRGNGYLSAQSSESETQCTRILKTEKFEEQGRGILMSLREFTATPKLASAVRLTPRGQRRRVRTPAVATLKWVSPILLLGVSAFWLVHERQVYLTRLSFASELSESQKSAVASMVEAARDGQLKRLGDLSLLLKVLDKHGAAGDRATVANVAVRLAPENEGLLLAAVDAIRESAGPDAALDFCLARISDPNEAGAQLLLQAIRCAGDSSRTAQAVTYLRELGQRDTLTPEEFEECVGHSLASQQTELARHFLTRFEQTSTERGGLRIRTLVALADNDRTLTEALCDEIVREGGDSLDSLLFAGDCYYWSACFSKAADAWVRAAKLEPLTDDAEERLADALLQSGQYADALTLCRKCGESKDRSQFRMTVALELLTRPDLKTLVPDLTEADLQLKNGLLVHALEEKAASERLIWAMCSAHRNTSPELLVSFLHQNQDQIKTNPDLLRELAGALFQSEEYAQAISVLDDLERRNMVPTAGSDDVVLLKARSLAGLQRYAEAGEILTSVLSRKPGDNALANETAGVLLTAGEAAKALNVMRGVADAASIEESARMMISVLSANNEWDELLLFLPRVKASETMLFEVGMAEAQAMFATTRFADGVGVLRNLMPKIAEGQERQQVQLLLARGLVWNQQFDEATSLLLALPDQLPLPDGEDLEEAILSAMLGHRQPPSELAQRAQQLIDRLRSQQLSEKRQLLACDVMLKLKRADDVVQWLTAGVQPEQLAAVSRMRLANAFVETKQFQSALKCYETLLTEVEQSDEHDRQQLSNSGPGDLTRSTIPREELLLAAARCAANAGETERGVKYFEDLVEKFSCKPEVLCEYSGLLLQQGRVREAMQHLPDSAALTAEQRILVIDVMIADNKLAEAKALAESMAGDPAERAEGDRQLLERLAAIEQVRGDNKAAAKYYQKLIDLGESKIAIRASLAQQLVLSGDMPRALENYRLLVEADELPESERFWLLLALNRSQTIPAWSLRTLNAAGKQALEDSDYPFRETEQLAYLHVRAGNKSTALTLIRKLLQVPEAEREDLLLFASNLAAELGEFRESEEFLTKLRTLRQVKTNGDASLRGATARKPSRQ